MSFGRNPVSPSRRAGAFKPRGCRLVAPEEHLVELLCPHLVSSNRIGEPLLERVAAIAVENEADMSGHRSGADLSTQPVLIELIEEARHARRGIGSRSRPDISVAVSRKRDGPNP